MPGVCQNWRLALGRPACMPYGYIMTATAAQVAGGWYSKVKDLQLSLSTQLINGMNRPTWTNRHQNLPAWPG